MTNHGLSRGIITALGLCLLMGAVSASPMQELDGKPSSIEQYTGKGKWTVVMIWASDCLICNKEAKHYEQFHQAHKNKDAVVLGVSMDGRENIKAAQGFVSEHKLTFPNIIGEPQDIADFFYSSTGENWVGTPTFLIYSPQGKLAVQQVGAVPVPLLEEFLLNQTANNK